MPDLTRVKEDLRRGEE